MLVGYARTSTVEQDAGLEAQERDLRAAGWTVVHWTFEQMLLGDRPALRWLEQALGVRASADPGWLHSSRPPSRRRVAGA